jgi:hypothetical protein
MRASVNDTPMPGWPIARLQQTPLIPYIYGTDTYMSAPPIIETPIGNMALQISSMAIFQLK